MAAAGTVLLIAAGVGLYAWLIFRRLGVGQPGGKPDCGCGTGKACPTKETNP